MLKSRLSLLGLALVAVAPAQSAIHDGDRIVFYGDSITDNAPYTAFVETYILTHHPKMNVRFFNAGVGGDRVSGGWMGPIDLRMTRDLFSRKPTVVTVMLGMNDAGYQTFNQSLFDQYRNGYRHIADRLKAEAPNARVWLFQPSPYDDFTRSPSIRDGGYNAVLQRYGAFVSDLARERGFKLVDQNSPLADALTKAKEIDAKLAPNIVADRVHPWTAGHLVMAATLLRSWALTSPVSRTEIDASSPNLTGVGVAIKDVKRDGGLSWTSTEESLPFPIDRKDATVALMLKAAPVEDWLGREMLVVRNLQGGDYQLSIDGKAVGRFSSDALAAGVDLAAVETPMLEQARRVHDLTTKRTALKYQAWRQIEFALADMPARSRNDALRNIERLEDDVIRQQHRLAQPVPHRFQLSKV